MGKVKLLFMIPTLGQGGAEKVLVNLVNNLDKTRFDITVLTLFDGGVNKQFLKPWIKFRACMPHPFRGNTYFLKLFSPERLYRRFIREKYDIVVSYLEGPTARIVSGCFNEEVKLVSWIHSEQHNMTLLAKAFRSPKEALRCYNRFDQTVCVSSSIQEDFCKILHFKNPCKVLYNTLETSNIIKQSMEKAPELLDDQRMRLIAVGTLKKVKGFERLLKIVKRLTEENYPVHLYILGKGPQEKMLQQYILDNNLEKSITLLGYKVNPYRIISKCNLFVCSSFSEGFSTATLEAMIVGTAVCTVEVPGMREMLGNSEYGLIVRNSEEALYEGIKKLIDDKTLCEQYAEKARERARHFSTESTVTAEETLFMKLAEDS